MDDNHVSDTDSEIDGKGDTVAHPTLTKELALAIF